MPIETIPLSQLEANPGATLRECADSGRPVAVQLSDRRLIAIRAVESPDDDLTDSLLESDAGFRALVAKSAASPRKPFAPSSGA